MALHVIVNLKAGNGAERSLSRLLDHRGQDSVFDIQIGRALPASLWGLFKILRRGDAPCVVAWTYWGIVFVEILSLFVRGRSYAIIWNIRQSFRDPKAIRWKTRWVIYALGALSAKRKKIFNSADASEAHASVWTVRRDTVIQNGYDLDGSAQAYQPDGPPRDKLRIGFIARNHAQKDPALFFSIIAALDPEGVEVSVFGTGYSEQDKLRFSQMAAPVPVTFHGYCDSDLIYGQIDVAVLTSRTEGFPNVVAEAILNNVPMFATRVGDVGLMLAPEFVFDSRQKEICAQQIEQYLSLPAAPQRAAFARSFERVSQFDIKRMLALYDEVLE